MNINIIYNERDMPNFPYGRVQITYIRCCAHHFHQKGETTFFTVEVYVILGQDLVSGMSACLASTGV